MTFPLSADTDLLRRQEFQEFLSYMRDAHEALVDGAGPPQLVPPRAEIDGVVNDVLPDSWEALIAVAEGFTNLPGLDANQLQQLAALIEAMEAANTTTATNAFDGSGSPGGTTVV